uniref:Succinate dehydrogenase assembly factor 4, mitochondrial n=1 Tax=Onchocerca volvulus TaxID=6282 RepID=A0A8R1TNW2_ONCVO
MLRVFRGRGIIQLFCSQQRFCRTRKGVVSEKEIDSEIQKKTPRGKLDHELEMEEEEKPYEDPNLPKHPGGVNPITGEIGGPAGLEPTRFGDWERKGRCVDF